MCTMTEEPADERAIARKYGLRELVYPDVEQVNALTQYLADAIETRRGGAVPKTAVVVMRDFLQGVLNRQSVTKSPRMSTEEFDALLTPYYVAARIVTKIARESESRAAARGKVYQKTWVSLNEFIHVLENLLDPGCYWMRVGQIPDGMIEAMNGLWRFARLYPEAQRKGRAM
jgi:hypothetical protein